MAVAAMRSMLVLLQAPESEYSHTTYPKLSADKNDTFNLTNISIVLTDINRLIV
jgi:hypothetical protein